MGPMDFLLSIHPVGKLIKTILNISYLDDGVLGEGEVRDGGVRRRPTEQAELRKKITAQFPKIQWPKDDQLTLLGTPLPDSAIVGVLGKRIAEVQRLTTTLNVLKPHHGFFLLKNCLSLPKLMYVLQTSPAWKNEDDLRVFNEVVKCNSQSITNVKMSGSTWEQAPLPVGCGGLGVSSAQELASTAYVESVHAVSPIVTAIRSTGWVKKVESVVQLWQSSTGKEPPIQSARGVQKS